MILDDASLETFDLVLNAPPLLPYVNGGVAGNGLISELVKISPRFCVPRDIVCGRSTYEITSTDTSLVVHEHI